MLKKVIDHAMQGVAISFILTSVMLFAFARGFSGAQVINAYILWMVAGVFYGGISLIYDTNLNKTMAAVIHVILTMGLSFAAFETMFRYIFEISMNFSYAWLFAGFIFVYIMISVISYIYNRISVKALNEKLKKNTDK